MKANNIYLISLQKVALVFLLYLLSRILFFLFNIHIFNDIGTGELIATTIKGIPFDLSTLFMLNLPFIVFNTAPIPGRFRKTYQRINNILFYYFANIIGLAANFVDAVYFRFTLKRSTADVFTYIANEENEVISLLPQYISHFWLEFLSWIIFVFLLVFLNQKSIKKPSGPKPKNGSDYLWQALLFVAVIAISITGIRGGFQLKPIGIMNAARQVDNRNIALVLNTPFTLIKTIGQPALKKVNYHETDALKEIYTPVHHPDSSQLSYQALNVVVIVLEGFSAEHSGLLNPHYHKDSTYQGYTPFLDSLMLKSRYIKAYANGKRSIESIPAIVAALPALMSTDFLTSSYSRNNLNSLAGLLKERGYQTSFFHGGNNGTMSFDLFSKMAGFKKYYGRNEFNNEEYYDGKWGIFDEPFFQYFKQKLDETPEPFFTLLFSVSSHHPYTLPEKYKNSFKEGPLKIHKTIRYTDHSLKAFFSEAKKSAWYHNTLFVITADHTSQLYFRENQGRVGNLEIPLVFFFPGDTVAKRYETTAQQIDIMPTLLSILNYNKPFVAFGNDIFDTAGQHFAINYNNGSYQLIRGDHSLIRGINGIYSMYNIREDKLQKTDIAQHHPQTFRKMISLLEAIIQQYNHRMINNHLTLEEHD